MKLDPSEKPDAFDVTFERKEDIVVFVNAMNNVYLGNGMAGIRQVNLTGALLLTSMHEKEYPSVVSGLSKGFLTKCAEGLIKITEQYKGPSESLPNTHGTAVTGEDYVNTEELFRETLAIAS